MESPSSIVNLDEAVFGICVNGNLWDGEYEKALPDNRLAAFVCRDEQWGLVMNDETWEDTFESMTGMALNETGDAAAVVQVTSMAAADVNAFSQGFFSVAKNGGGQ